MSLEATATKASRFARRVAFGLRPDQDPPSDPLAWAQNALTSPHPIGLYDATGRPRTDLPDWVFLRNSLHETMVWFGKHEDADLALREDGKDVSKEAFLRLRREKVLLPFYHVEHWKEVQARASTAVTSRSPVFEKLWHFWANHFMVAPGNQRMDTLVGPYQRMLRTQMQGSYRDMLWQAVTHPAMLLYLDNNRSTGPNATAARNGRRRESINENLGRELLELFTLSPASGYTQQDVEQATLILTGWRENYPGRQMVAGAPFGTYFDHNRHEPGSQTVLGKTYSNTFRPHKKLEDLITDLASHPATADLLARKLCTYFIADTPPQKAVDHIRSTYMSSQGSLPKVHAALLEMVWAHMESSRKLSTPESWLYQWHVLTGAELPAESFALGFSPGVFKRDVGQILKDIGQALPHCPQPDGWPTRSVDWISKELLDRRLRFSLVLANNLRRQGSLSEDAVNQIMARELPPDSETRSLVASALQAKQLPRALTLLMISPELLWS